MITTKWRRVREEKPRKKDNFRRHVMRLRIIGGHDITRPPNSGVDWAMSRIRSQRKGVLMKAYFEPLHQELYKLYDTFCNID